jgi:probable F420-dependent oxidoreductase
MGTKRPFRFGVESGPTTSPDEWIASVRRAEDLGYAAINLGIHVPLGYGGPFAAMATAAAVTTSLRVTTTVIPNDFYSPAMLALEAGTFDRLSGGRLDLGIGAGWLKPDFDALGLPFPSGEERLGRLEEALHAIRLLMRGEATAPGKYYPALGPLPGAAPAQQPHPPIFVGGGGRRILEIAAREADIVGLDLKGRRDGRIDVPQVRAERVAERVNFVREAAGDRFDALELHILCHNVFVVDDPVYGAQLAADRLASFPPEVVVNADLTVEELMASPHVLVGSVDHIADTLQERRERYGISYVSVMAPFLDTFAPVVARLAGT